MAKYVNLDDSEVIYCGSDGDYEKYNIPYDMPFADVVELEGSKVYKCLSYTTTGIPTANVFERKVGKWKLNREGNLACPFCEFNPYHDEMNGMNYCPNCGARLEGFDNGKVH